MSLSALVFPIDMGIPGLTSFMEWYFADKWRQCQLKGHLVIDGYNICYSLHSQFHIDWIHGGQYWEFRHRLIEFFTSLTTNDIEPVVVFDGVDSKRKKEAVVWRRKEEKMWSIQESLIGGKQAGTHILPLLATQVFRKVLEELHIPLYFADGEADWDTVAMANHYQCPVVALDSDYFMFNIDAGYIPINKLHWENRPITAELYMLGDFVKSFRFATSEMPLLIPAVLGNDFLSNRMFPALKDDFLRSTAGIAHRSESKRDEIHRFVRYISRFHSYEEIMEYLTTTLKGGENIAHSIDENYTKSKEMYIIKYHLTVEYFMSSTQLVSSNGTTIPEWILRQYRCGFFVPALMEILVLGQYSLPVVTDNPKRTTAQNCSRPIRQCIYTILLPYMEAKEVKEIVRFEGNLRLESVSFANKMFELPTIDKIQELTLSQRIQALCTVMHCDPSLLEAFEKKWQLVVLASCYWAKFAMPDPHIVQCLVICFLLCARDKDPLTLLPQRVREDRNNRWLDALHAFSMWQSTYNDALKINSLLLNPLLFFSPALLFDGRLILSLACEHDLSFLVQRELRGSSLYERFLSTIMSYLPQTKKSKKPSQTSGGGKAIVKSKTVSQSAPVTSANHFAMLKIDSDEEENDEEDDS